MRFGEIVIHEISCFLGEASLNNIHFTKYSPMNYGEVKLIF